MASLMTIARPYARAAYQYAVAHDVVAHWQAMLHGLSYVAKDKRVRRYSASPELTAEQSVAVFFDIGKELIHQTKAAGKNFLMVMAENKRLLLLPQVAQAFDELYAQDHAQLDVDVISAEPLSQGYKDKIIAALEKRFDKSVLLHCHTDKTLLGGAIIRAGDFVIDGSVSGKLQRMQQELIA